MNMDQFRIKAYRPEFGADVLAAIGEDPDWELLTKTAEKRDKYKKMLQRGAAFVCYDGASFCGHIRAVVDEGFAVYISELFVKPDWRNNGIGQRLIETVKTQYSALTVYALSDEDLFYEKKGYKKAGSVFEI